MSGYQNTLTLDITIDVIERVFVCRWDIHIVDYIWHLSLFPSGGFYVENSMRWTLSNGTSRWTGSDPMPRIRRRSLSRRHMKFTSTIPIFSLHCRQIFHVATLPWVKLTLVAASVQSEVSKTGGGTSFSQKRTERKPTGNFYNYEHNERPAVEAKASYKFSTKAQKLIGTKAHPSTKKCIVHFGAFSPYQLRLLVAADWPLQPAECHWGGH